MVAFTMGFCLFDCLVDNVITFSIIAKNEQACELSFQFFTGLVNEVVIPQVIY